MRYTVRVWVSKAQHQFADISLHAKSRRDAVESAIFYLKNGLNLDNNRCLLAEVREVRETMVGDRHGAHIEKFALSV